MVPSQAVVVGNRKREKSTHDTHTHTQIFPVIVVLRQNVERSVAGVKSTGNLVEVVIIASLVMTAAVVSAAQPRNLSNHWGPHLRLM